MLNAIYLFFQIIFLLYASPTNQILNLTEFLHQNQNLTLNESVSYYLDRSLEISSNFEILGKNNDLNLLTLNGNISNFFIIDNGIQVAFTNLNFFFDASEIAQISYIFLVQNASKISFLAPKI